MSSSSSSAESVSSPEAVSESRGSSVTTGLREEYEDLLRYAVVTPVLNRSVGGLPSSAKTSQMRVKNKKNSAVPPPRASPPPRPHTPPRHVTRSEMKVKVSKVESEDSRSELSDTAPQSSIAPQVAAPPLPPPHLPELETSSTSNPSNDYANDTIDPLVATPEVARLETQIDAWCLDLKRNVLVEFDQAKILMMERHQAELMKERQRHAHEIEQLREELERYKELLVTYEQTIARKDHIIANLTRALQKQKDHVDLQRTFSSWKLRHVNDKRESFTSTLAKRHHDRRIMSQVWTAWIGIVQGRWKHKVEKACQSKAEEVCVQLTGQYEEQVSCVQKSLESCQQEVEKLKAERNLYEENMKKAFMRGVCALNLEAMNMFQHHENQTIDQQHNQADATESQSISIPLHVNAGSKTDSEPSSSHPDVPITQLTGFQSQPRSGTSHKSAHVTTSVAGNSLQLSRPKVGTSSSKNCVQRTSRHVPVVIIEKH